MPPPLVQKEPKMEGMLRTPKETGPEKEGVLCLPM